MNKTYKIITISLAFALVAATATVFGVRTYRHYRDKDKQDQQHQQQDNSSGYPIQNGNQTFLWKPVSGTRQGRCGVLLPARVSAYTITANGEPAKENAGRCPDAGDYRLAFFMARTGAAYGAPVVVKAVRADGSVVGQWTVPNGAARWGKQ
jgi:hypothetical protein